MINQKYHVLFISLGSTMKKGGGGVGLMVTSFLLPPSVVHTLYFYILILYGNFRKHFCSTTAPADVFGSLDNTKEEVGKERFRFAYIKNRLK